MIFYELMWQRHIFIFLFHTTSSWLLANIFWSIQPVSWLIQVDIINAHTILETKSIPSLQKEIYFKSIVLRVMTRYSRSWPSSKLSKNGLTEYNTNLIESVRILAQLCRYLPKFRTGPEDVTRIFIKNSMQCYWCFFSFGNCYKYRFQSAWAYF